MYTIATISAVRNSVKLFTTGSLKTKKSRSQITVCSVEKLQLIKWKWKKREKI